MFRSRLVRRYCRGALPHLVLLALATQAFAGNGANFVTYDHHTGEKGETEIKLYNDLGRTAEDGQRYNAQLLEIEHALTDQWIWRLISSRTKRMVRIGVLTASVLRPAIACSTTARRSIQSSISNTSTRKRARFSFAKPQAAPTAAKRAKAKKIENERESELETKLILGHDISDRLRVGFNWISEVDFKSGDWAFGYAAGLTYTLFEQEGAKGPGGDGWTVKEVKLGAELFGGAGDSVQGLTLDGSEDRAVRWRVGENRILEWCASHAGRNIRIDR